MNSLEQWKKLKERYGLKSVSYDELISLPQEKRDSFFEEAKQILPGLLLPQEYLLNNPKICRTIDSVIEKYRTNLA